MKRKFLLLMLALIAMAITVRAQENMIDGHEYVDLGLPSGTLWASCNVGATKPEEYGDYFAWGETKPKSEYNWGTYKWMNTGQSSWSQINKYTFADSQTSGCWYDGNGHFIGDSKTELDLEDDAAYVNWGSNWRMPSRAQQDELRSQCTWTWTQLNGVNGYRVTSKTNGNSIFLPAAGWRDDTSLRYAGSFGYCWSRSLTTYYSNSAYYLGFKSGNVGCYSCYRFLGQSVRPVVVKKQSSGLILNAENFPDANFRAALAKILGISEGDEITEAKIAATTSLDVSSKQIADLTGIEHFTALTRLRCYDNQLTSLDVSKNTALEYLRCYENQLTSLDVSKNPALEELNCGGNPLTSLDVSKNMALTGLSCWNNQLTSLDVSKNTALTNLWCHSNQLTSLDVSQNTALDWLQCYENQLTSLDVSQNTALTRLECHYNQLTSLDVSQNTALTQLWCYYNQLTSLDVSGCTALTRLSCSSNRLTSLDVSGCTALKELACSSNQLTSLDVSQNTALTQLWCSSNQLTSLDVSQNTVLTSLSCYGNQLTSLDVSQNTALTSLSCSSNQLTSLDVSQNTALTSLNCSSNQLTSLDVSQNTALRGLECYGNQIKGEAMDALVASLPTVEWGEFIVINTNDENEGNVCTKSQVAVAKGKGWTVYDLNGGNRPYPEYEGSDDAAAKLLLNAENFPDANFRAALAKILGISEGDEITDEMIAATTWFRVFLKSIADLTGIEHFTALERLECFSNQLTSLDVSKNTALRVLYCYGNQLTSLDVSGCTALTALFCYDNQLTSLDVSGCTALTRLECYSNQLTSLDVSGCTALTRLECYDNQLTSLDVSGCTALTRLECYSNQLTSLDVSGCTALTRLECYSNQLTSLDVSKNTVLETLSCRANQLTSLDVSKNTALTGLACANNQLTSLDVSQNNVLEQLYCDGNQLTSLDVSKNTALTGLSCDGNQLTSLDVSKNTALTGLSCANNQLTSLDVSKNTALTGLACANNQLTSLDVSQNNVLEQLYCDGNQLTSLDVSQNTALGMLYCYHNQIRGVAMDVLVNSLPTVMFGQFYVINTKDANEGNVCTKAQVAVAKGKGWRVYDWNYDGSNYWAGFVEYEGSDPVAEDIDPVDEDDNIDFGTDMNDGEDLNGNVIGDIYYNINTGNGGYDAAKGCIVVKKPTDDGTVNDLEGKDIFGEDFKSQFTGIVFKVPAGKGAVKVNAETTGNMLLKVKIGANDPVEMELNGKLKVTFPYNVSEPTYVYIYAGAANEAKGFGAPASGDAALKIYGIEFIRDNTPTEINTVDSGELTVDSWYTIDGKKLAGEPKEKGIYIRNGRKVVK